MFDYAQNYLSRKENTSVRTYNKCHSHITKFKKFIGKDQFSVSHLTYELLLRYENYLREDLGNSINTVTTNMKTLKELTAEMYEEFRLDTRNNPFRKYKMKSTPTERPCLSEREYFRVRNLKLIMQGKLYDARQLFVFESETGIRISDILKLRWQNYDGHYIQIIMDKTDRQLKIPASDLVKDDIERQAFPSRRMVLYSGEFCLMSTTACQGRKKSVRKTAPWRESILH